MHLLKSFFLLFFNNFRYIHFIFLLWSSAGPTRSMMKWIYSANSSSNIQSRRGISKSSFFEESVDIQKLTVNKVENNIGILIRKFLAKLLCCYSLLFWANVTEWNNFFLRLYQLVHKCISPPVEHISRLDLLWVQSGTTPCF